MAVITEAQLFLHKENQEVVKIAVVASDNVTWRILADAEEE